MFPEPDVIGKYFHELFKVLPDQQKKKAEWKKNKKGKVSKGKVLKGKEKRKPKLDGVSDMCMVPEVELAGNASNFAVFATVRLAVLERWMKEACEIYLSSSGSSPAALALTDVDSDVEESSERLQVSLPRIPKIVGVGLRSVFELIRESRNSQPAFCTKALRALLDILQGQQPEGLKHEPAEVIDPLFELLLDLATLHGPLPDSPDDGSHLTAVACACLLSLVTVRGDTGRLLCAVAALLMSPRALAYQNIMMPSVLASLQRSVHGVLLGKTARPDWISCGVPKSSYLMSFDVKLPAGTDHRSSIISVSSINNSSSTYTASASSSSSSGSTVILAVGSSNGNISNSTGSSATRSNCARALASDGRYLYLHNSKGLFKIGSGYGGTLKGHIYMQNHDFYNDKRGWLGYAQDCLYFRLLGTNSGVGRGELVSLETDDLTVQSVTRIDSYCDGVMFSDGEFLGVITSAKDDGFVVRTVNPSSTPTYSLNELPLKLARKCVDVCGVASFDEESAIHTLHSGTDDEVASIVSGKEFSLIRTTFGKVLYCGKSASLGMKQGGKASKWAELIIPKSPKVSMIAAGHDGLHAVLVAEDGSVFFTGTARRGEDSDQNKVRRQPKAVKPKKISKVDGQIIIHAACNNGTTALVTKDGELIMFGKDTTHCDPSTGVVTDLKDVQAVQVSLGKAHAAVLTSKGHLYTFGINNKGQCGRDFASQVKEATVVAMETTVEEEGGEEEELEWDDAQEAMCVPGTHKWKHDLCMVCTICRECTGYSISCLSSMRPDRNPGQECGCGEGDSGCAECGCCRICARESVDNSELAILGPSGAGDIAGMMRLDLIFGGGRHGARLQDHLQRRLDERKQRQRGKVLAKHGSVAGSAIGCGVGVVGSAAGQLVSRAKQVRSSVAPVQAPNKTIPGVQLRSAVQPSSSIVVEEMAGGSDVEREASRVTSLPPARVYLPNDSPVIQIASGLHHTVALTQSGDVYTFGSNSYGQLGCGDIMVRGGPVHVKLPGPASHVAAGSNHTVVLLTKGEVYTFGSHQRNQLGRNPPELMSNKKEAQLQGQSSSGRSPWYSIPGPVPQVGPRHGRRATWVGASAEQTYLKLDESLINSISLTHSSLMANKNCIVLLPTECVESKSFKCLVINKRDGNCSSFSGPLQVDFSRSATCLDPFYNVLWSYNEGENGPEVSCYNAVCSETRLDSIPGILYPELALPNVPGCFVTRSHAALHLLGALDTLTQAQDLHLTVRPHGEEKISNQNKIYTWEDFSSVTRFESHGGGWGYSGHSIEAIRFMADTDILLGGFGLFGGRGEYTGKIKLFDIGLDGGEQENDGEMLAETDEIPYECGPRQKYPMLFEEPVPLQANRWYVAWARVSGPSSDCGSGGQGMVTTEDQVVFYFKSSKKSNNGTDVNAGQIPQLLYRIVTTETQTTGKQSDNLEPLYILSREFSRTVSKECFQSLLALLQWSWNTYRAGLADVGHSLVSGSVNYMATLFNLERLVYICKATLRLICTYTNEMYPNQVILKKQAAESVVLAECIGDVRALLRQILLDSVPAPRSSKHKKQVTNLSTYNKMTKDILDECHETFVACFHAFYPTAYLKWTCLCELLASMDKTNKEGASSSAPVGSSDRLISAVVAALCSRSVRLRSTFPLLSPGLDNGDNSLKKQLSPSDNSGLPMMPCIDTHYYPILVEQMSFRSQLETSMYQQSSNVWQFREVLDKLLNIVTLSVKQALCLEKVTHSSELVYNCCHLLVRVVAELSSQANGIDEELEGACGRVLHSTPSRFTRTNQSRTWNTGNGSPDAICFSVDRPGIVIAGAAVYGGVGTYNYELELLDDQNNTSNDPSHTQRWNSLQLTTGVFGPDDCLADDIVELKFDYPVFIKENVKYAIRLRNHGGRTSNGDGGLSSVKGPDGVVFSFSTCSLSFNGTTQTRGQIPYLLYYSNPQDSDGQTNNKAAVEMQARKITLKTAGAIVNRCVELLVLARERAEEVNVSELLGSACLVTTLLPLMLAHISPLATSDPKSGVQVLSLIQELLPHVAALNLLTCNMGQSTSTIDSTNCHDPATATTTSHHYAWVESEHPYKPASVSNYRVLFPETVRWLAVEFSPECGTAQAEDSLQLYIPTSSVPSNNITTNAAATANNSNNNNNAYTNNNNTNNANAAVLCDETLPYWPVLHKFSNQWPQHAIVLPGNEVIFSLETASDYVKDEKACFYGFRCLVIGYEWQMSPGDGLRQLEMELSFLGGMCAASLMKKDLVLPILTAEEFEEDMETVEETARQIFSKHSALLGKGFALANPPTITQALDGILPYSCHSNERLFLRDLVQCVPGTSGGRLSRWLQPDPYVDPSRCQVLYSRDDMRCGWPANITIFTKDQYGDLVYVPNLKVEVKAVPIDKKEINGEGSLDNARKLRRVSQPDEMTFGGHALPCLDVPYEVTVKDKMCYYAISIMKAYENYSFEELRYTSPAMKRSSENMLVRPNSDGSYSVTWTPGSVGWYSILTTIDGYSMDEGYKVEVKEPPQGLTPPNQSIVRKTSHQPNRLRKFVAKNSAGLRVRAHPSLQSEQIGIVHVNGTIAFIDEIHNDDGVWLRLNQETIRQYCSGAYAEAWCLQYNQHLGKTLLLPLQEPKSILDHVIKETIMRKTPSSDSVKPRPHAYKVVLCGASGHNVRSKPSLKAPPIGMLVLGNTITVTDHLVNSEGTWVQLDKDTMNKYCFTWDGEAWSLASDKTPYIYLQPEPDIPTDGASSTYLISSDGDTAVNVANKKGFDFSSVPDSVTSNFPIQVFTSGRDTPQSASSSNTNPFVFGSPSMAQVKDDIKPYIPSGSAVGGGGSRSSPVTRWLKPEDGKEKPERKYHSSRDLPPELLGVSVKELVKAIGESRANGNGVTPPDTPRRASRSSSPHLQSVPSGSHATVTSESASSSPVPIPGAGTSTGGACGSNVRGRLADSRSSSPPLGTSPRSIPLSPLVSAESGRRGSTQSDTSALVSSLTRDPTPSASPSPSSSSMYTPSDTPKKTKDKENVESESSSKLMAQAGTQTSPEGVKGHFSIGAGGSKDESKLSPKLSRKERPCRNKRTMSPASPHTSPQQLNNLRGHHSQQQHTPNREPVKEALSPSVAESLRATFAAFLWHEGIVHDAMACASFLKFHPTLPKQGALVITRHTDRERVTNQRHSVEVSTAGSYLHIKPSTLETLTRSAANANANRHRKKQQPQTQPSQSQTQSQQPQQQGMIREEGFKSGDEDGGASGSGVVCATSSGNSGSNTYQTTVTVLPPALKCLVLLWEELTSCCLQTFAANAVLPSPTVMMGSSVLSNVAKVGVGVNQGVSNEGGKRTSRKKKEWKPNGSNNTATNVATAAANAGNVPVAGSSAGGRGAGTERESLCELCGGIFPHPITYHMRQAHPGCGGHAGGKGYNSGGNYCVGWAGNCGDGGVGGSSWYLVCDNCRDRYLKGKKPSTAKKLGRKKGFISLLSDANNKIVSPASLPVSTEMHRVMKANAMFLLELSGISNGRSVNQSPPEQNSAFPPPGPFQCLYSLGVHPSQLRDDSHFLPEEMIQCRESRDIFTPMRAVTESPASDSDGEGNRGRLFHRSISMGTNGAPWSRQEGDGRIIMMRKRNNSTCEIPTDAGSSLLCHPSPALQKLVPSAGQSAIVSGTGPGAANLTGQISNQDTRLSIDILSRPVLLFLLEQHNLRSLQLAMKQALRKATCRVYAMQALNWLLRSVTQATSIHDLLWWLVAALTPATFVPEAQADHEPKEEGAGEPKPEKKDEVDLRGVCEHPLSDMSIVGQAVHPLPFTFHTLLQTVSDLMVLLPMGSSLQQMAVRCFGIHFTQADHTFLHRCHVFSNISKILSRSEEEQEDAATASLQESSHHSTYLQVSNSVETLRDLTHSIDIKASSRQAMVGSLTDNSTETFWESGDEDRNKTKMLTLTCPPHSSPRMIYIHIDNCRDLANKVSNVTFFSGFNCEELVKLRTVEVESRATGWLNCTLLDTRHNILRLELKGPDNSLRLRQIRVLGGIQNAQLHQHQGEPVKYSRQHSAVAIQQHNTEAETLKVFRLITSQVFGKLITGEQEEPSSYLRLEGDENEESNDLKEHVVGILFSRSKLTHLQKQVCAHIVQAIRRETMLLREEWESKLCSAAATTSVIGSNSDVAAPDTYCFEMLSMVLALSGSSVGRSYLSQQHGLINDLLSLLHTGSARVQRQVTGLVRRMLPEVSPTVLANLTGVNHLPPTDFSIAQSAKDAESLFDCHRVGILDVFLSCIAKALTVQVKVKSKDGKGVSSITLATSIHPRDPVGPRWWIRGCISRRLAEDIIQLVKDMAAGKLSEVWARVTKAAIAENIINLTRLSESQRNPSECLRCPTLWIALASLCVLDNDHVERLSSTQWRNTVDGNPPPPRPTCNNHDDGETNAIIQCNQCGNLCADCDRFLHLHRKTRMHHRQVCKEEEEAIKVDLHEGCGRTKLFWALLLADSCTLKAMVEFREGARSNTKTPGMVSGICRFCGATDNSGLLAIGNICADQECQEHGRNVCTKLHTCGHLCGGIKGETECLPCLHNCSGDQSLKQDSDDMCMICFTEALSCAPALQLKCGHVFHLHCCRNVLQKKWAGPRITFSFSQCPICKAPMDHPVLNGLLSPIRQLYEDVRRKALMRLEYEGLDKGRIDPAIYAMDRYAYYVCFKCCKAYYGGEARCDAELGGSEFDPSELVCGACSDVSRAQMCPKHGTDFLEYKCRYCCSVAVFFCFGTTHFCNACHDDFQRVTNIPRAELPSCPAGPKAKSLDGDECPLHVKHPPTGEEFALGCGVCRNAHTF